MSTPITLASGSKLTWREMTGSQSGGRNFALLVHSMDGDHDDAKVKTLAHLQAVAFHMPAAQKEVHSYWTTPACLAVLGKREYLPLADPRITQDYQEGMEGGDSGTGYCAPEVCHPCARAFPNTFCRAGAGAQQMPSPCGQGSCNLFNMEMEILEEARRASWLPLL